MFGAAVIWARPSRMLRQSWYLRPLHHDLAQKKKRSQHVQPGSKRSDVWFSGNEYNLHSAVVRQRDAFLSRSVP
jgi:hypothetical protein